MKRVFTVVHVRGEGNVTPLHVRPLVRFDHDKSYGGKGDQDFAAVSFNTEAQAQDWARGLARDNPGKRYDVVMSVSSYRAENPVTETTKFD